MPNYTGKKTGKAKMKKGAAMKMATTKKKEDKKKKNYKGK